MGDWPVLFFNLEDLKGEPTRICRMLFVMARTADGRNCPKDN